MSKPSKVQKTFYIFISYAHEDEQLRNGLRIRLNPLERKCLIKVWDNQSISAGSETAIEIEGYINEAHIILFLVSPNFLGSDQYHQEVDRSVEQNKMRGTYIISILLRPSDWRNTQLKDFYILPSNENPITKWEDEDEAFQNVLEGIRKELESLLLEEYKKLEVGFQEKIHLCEREAKNNPNNISLLIKLALAWQELGDFQKANSFEAKSSYEEELTIHRKIHTINSESYIALSKQGTALEKLEKPEEAATSYEEGLEIKPNDPILLGKNSVLQEKLGNYDNAIVLYDKILKLDHSNYRVWTQRGTALRKLDRFKEAIESYNKALKIKPNYRAARYYQRVTYRSITNQL